MTRRGFVSSFAATLAGAAQKLPANQNVKWALSLALWNHFRPCPFTDVLDVMKDTGFIGIRVAMYPGVLKTYGTTEAQMQAEVTKRGLHVVTVSFNAPLHDPEQRTKVLDSARANMKFLAGFGANHLVVFTPGRSSATGTEAAFKEMCARCNQIGELAGGMGFTAGMHNHLNQMAESGAEMDRAMALTDPKLFGFSPDTAHVHLARANVVEYVGKYKGRIRFLDYKDAKWTTPTADFVQDNGKVLPKDSESARFFSSIYDLGDGEIDFPACHRILKGVNYRGWICVDLDTARKGPRASFERCGAYAVSKLEPIYR